MRQNPSNPNLVSGSVWEKHTPNQVFAHETYIDTVLSQVYYFPWRSHEIILVNRIKIVLQCGMLFVKQLREATLVNRVYIALIRIDVCSDANHTNSYLSTELTPIYCTNILCSHEHDTKAYLSIERPLSRFQ